MKKYILIILCCLTSFPLWSYNVNMIVEHYSVDQGLPNNTVNCTLKDRDGFIGSEPGMAYVVSME